ncbi:hypothetical protein [Longimicrobium sp.]|uniref:hypothetical protein n=1 Tax=Longimicrobium sp. TaxID=2029185 RepID=UPI003B3ACFC0
MRAPRWVPALLAVSLWAAPAASQARPAAGEASLQARMDAFLTREVREDEDRAAAFFPRSGDFTWVETTHRKDGDQVGIWRFPAADFHAAYKGPLTLEDVLVVDYHGHRVGSLSHQIVIRRPRWRRAPGNRFVPADEPDSSPIYVQWRLEDGRWVISAIGDETFTDGPLPAWCC